MTTGRTKEVIATRSNLMIRSAELITTYGASESSLRSDAIMFVITTSASACACGQKPPQTTCKSG